MCNACGDKNTILPNDVSINESMIGKKMSYFQIHKDERTYIKNFHI